MTKTLFFLLIPFLAFTQHVFNNKQELQTAVDEYTQDQALAIANYGEMYTWDVSNVTDMSFLFADKTSFNSNISTWDVSNVINMSMMFRNATAFNTDLSMWNVGNVCIWTGCFMVLHPLIKILVLGIPLM